MEHLTQFEIVLTIVCVGFLFVGIGKFIAKFGLDWKEQNE